MGVLPWDIKALYRSFMSKAARGADVRVWEVATAMGLRPLGLRAHKWLILVRPWVVGRHNGMGHVEF